MNDRELIRWAHAETGRTCDPQALDLGETGLWDDKPHRVVWLLTDRLEEVLELNRRLTANINSAHRETYHANDLLQSAATDAFEATTKWWDLRHRCEGLADLLDREAATLDDPKAVGLWPRTREGMANIKAIREQYRAQQCNHVSISLRSIAAALRKESE